MKKANILILPVAAFIGFSGSAMSASSASCFNPALYKVGTTVDMVYNIKSPAGNGTMDFDTEVTRKTKYNGKNVLEVDATTVTTIGAQISRTEQKTYISANLKKKIEYYHGSIIEADATGTPSSVPGAGGSVSTTITTTIKPPVQDRFKLKKNKGYTQKNIKHTTETVTTVPTPIGDVATPFTSTFKQKHSKKFLGIGKVKVPAGTFQVCRYRVTDTDTAEGITTKTSGLSMISTKYGIEVKNVTGKTVTQLKSGTINGAKMK